MRSVLEGSRTTANDAVRAMDALRRLVRALHVSTHALEREFGISAARLFVLRQLALTPRSSLGEIAARARTSQSSASEVVTALARRGLVTRGHATDDRRRAALTLTPRGRAILERAPATVQEQLLAGFERLEAPRRRALIDGLESWLAESGLADVPSTMFFESSGTTGRDRAHRR
jgi:DNA-binding MarR family transcriptional regulator